MPGDLGRIDEQINIDTDYGEEQEEELDKEILDKLTNAKVPEIVQKIK